MAGVALLCGALSGCGGRDVELVEVLGQITLDGQPPPTAGTIFFTPYEALGEAPLRPGRAAFGSDGQFQASAFEDDAGLAPAKYRVGVHCWKIPPGIDGPQPQSYIPERYASPGTSGLELVVPSGTSRMQWNIELTSQPD